MARRRFAAEAVRPMMDAADSNSSRLGERDLARGALEKPETELAFELADQHRHARLRDEQLLRCAREALVAGREYERLELSRAEIHEPC